MLFVSINSALLFPSRLKRTVTQRQPKHTHNHPASEHHKKPKHRLIGALTSSPLCFFLSNFYNMHETTLDYPVDGGHDISSS